MSSALPAAHRAPHRYKSYKTNPLRDLRGKILTMKKLLHLLCLIISGILVVSCYDDSALWDSVKDHESRISKLEAQCKELNTNIASLKTLVDAYLSADYITDVTPVMEGGEEVGFVITFAKNGKITIYHGKDGAPGADGQDGKDGQDANAPKLGIRQDTDGSYYWTLNGDWLLDDNGDKIKAVGKDGADGANGADGVDGADGADGADGVDGVNGITPTLKIEEEYWYISYDGGQTWTNLGKAVGEDGKDSMFSNVYEDNGYIIFTLVDGTSYRIPTEATAATANTLDIQFSVEQGTAIVPDLTTKIKYTITGAEGSTLVRTSSYDYEVAFVKPIDDSTGFLYISMWSDFEGPDDPERDEPYYDNNEITEEEAYNSMLSIIVIVTDSKGNQVIKALNFVEGFLSSVDDVYLTDPVAGSVEAKLKTNVANDLYEIVIPDKCKDWISYVPTKAELREETLTFSVTANEGDSFRSANISLINELGQTFETFTILQRSTIAGEAITFADARVEALCVSRFDKNLDGVLTYEEAALVTDVEGLFENEKQIVSFDEFEHFSSVTTIPSGFFSECALLESVKLPESVMEIGSYAFENCVSLKSIVIPEGVTNSYNYSYEEDYGKYGYWFRGCSSLENITLPSTLKFLPSYGFDGCRSLKSITLPKGITKIPSRCFNGCSALTEITCKSPITSVGSSAFAECTSLKTFDLSSVESLGEGAFSLSGLTSAIIPEAITSIPSELFRGCSDLETVIMHDGIISIGNNSFSTASYYDENDNRIEKGCSSLKSLVLPAKLESIGYEAFYGSAIEGEAEDGTSAKLLNIPASVNTIGYEAFYNCPNISGVKMLGAFPPHIDYYVFDNGTPIYVQNNALQAYTDAYSGHSYPILPYDMMGLSLALELEVIGEGDYKYSDYYSSNYYSESVVDFLISAKVTGDESKLAQVTEYGYYITNYNDDGYNRGTTYFPLESLNVTQTDSLSVSGEYFEVNAEAYVATANCQVGAYLRLADDTIITYDKREMEFIYDRTPSVELIEAKQVETYRTGDNCDVTYEVMTRTSGAFWLNRTELEASGVGSISSYRYSYYDGDYKNTITWRYNVNEVPASMQIRFAYNASNGSSFTSNRITLTADISEASLLETIYKTTNGESWTRSDNWCSDRPLSEWYGITTDSEGNVTSINLENNNLSGSLKMYLSSFAKLTGFNIDNNQLNTLNIYGSDNIKSLEMTSCVNNDFYAYNFEKVILNKCDSLTLFTQNYCDTLKINDCHFSQSSQNNGISISDGDFIAEIKRSSIPYISIGYSYGAVSIENCLIDNCYIHLYNGSIVVNGSSMNTCELTSNYLTFQNSTASESWNGVTRRQLDIINSTCTGITNGNFNDDTVINLENATLWQSSWDEAPLGTFTRTLTGAEWPTLFQ